MKVANIEMLKIYTAKQNKLSNLSFGTGTKVIKILRHMLVWCLCVSVCVPVSTFALAQVPAEFLGKWSSERNRCIDDQSEGVTVFTIQKSTISWYEIDCKIGKAARTPDGMSFRASCVKGGGIRAPAVISIRRINEKSLNISVSGMDTINDVFFICGSKSSSTNADTCLNTVENVEGSLYVEKQRHPTGRLMTAYILRLDKPSCFVDDDGKRHPAQRELHLAPQKEGGLAPYVGRHVRINGKRPFERNTVYHFRELVVLDAEVVQLSSARNTSDEPEIRNLLKIPNDPVGTRSCLIGINSDEHLCTTAWFLLYKDGLHAVQFNRGTEDKPVIVFMGRAANADTIFIDRVNVRASKDAGWKEEMAIGQCVLGQAMATCQARTSDGLILLGKIIQK